MLKRFARRSPDRSSRPTPRYHPVAKAPADLSRAAARQSASVPAGCLPRCCSAQMGFKPIVLERGRDVRQRTQDTWALWRKKILTPESNVQFGEGGAGLFSDGKLYSQIKDPKFYGRKVMHEFVRAGAPPEILFVSKPHIGTFRLTGIVEKMRAEIIALGGEVRFESKVTDVLIEGGRIEGVMLESGETLRSRHVVLALGHSSRDTLRMLERRGVFLEAKPFAIGFRIEHPQSLVDRARFGRFAGHPELGAADYKLVHHASNGRSVYSFCMCPGGTVVAATSEPGRVVTNGMSQYSRNERNANAGIVVAINPKPDFPGGPLAGVALQEALESKAFELGGRDYCAPGQLVGDFLRGIASTQLGEVQPSYQPGVQARATSRRRCRPTPSTRFARRCRCSAGSSTASTATTRCSRASKAAPHRRCASRAMRNHCRVSTSAACTLAVKARVMPAESFPRASMASRWPKRSRGISHEIRRHQEAAPEEIPREAEVTSSSKASTWCRSSRSAAARDARLRDSEIYRDARLRALVEHAADARHPVQADGADQRDAFAAGHRRGGAAARAGRAARRRARGLSSRDPGSRQSRHHPAHAGVVRKFPLPAAVPTAWTCTTARWCARAWAPSSMSRWSSMCRWTRCAARFARIACAGSRRASRLRRRRSGNSTATCSATKRAACRTSR